MSDTGNSVVERLFNQEQFQFTGAEMNAAAEELRNCRRSHELLMAIGSLLNRLEDARLCYENTPDVDEEIAAGKLRDELEAHLPVATEALLDYARGCRETYVVVTHEAVEVEQ